VVDFFIRFTAKFPTVEDLAEASFEEALPYFRGLGFYGRLRRMLLTAQAVVERSRNEGPKIKMKEEDKDLRRGGSPCKGSGVAGRAEFPKEIEELEKLPGIGPYTARAIASFAYGQRVLAPDTNVARIIARFYGVEKEYKEFKDHKEYKGEMMKWVMGNLEFFDANYPEDFSLNQVLMDLGSQICKARTPQCSSCPLIKKCSFGRNPSQFERMTNDQKTMTNKMTKRGQRSLRSYQKIVVGILIQDKSVLVSRRREDQTFTGLLEFPGGKVEEGEDLRAAMQREFREEVGFEVSVRPPFEKIALHRQKLVLNFHRCRVLTKQNDQIPNNNDQPFQKIFKGLEGQDLMWIHQTDLDAKQFLPANKGIIEALKKSRL
jgi:A/G-specific adenine glycosylase